jgi:hypothetical protein
MAALVPLAALDGPALALARLLARGDEEFVREAYWAFMGREPDPRGLRDCLERMDAGAPRFAILEGLARSPECQERGLASRSLAELTLAQARARESVPDSLEALLGFFDDAFVSAAYRVVMGREADRGGRAHYLGRVRQGEPRIDVLHALRVSQEGREQQEALRAAGDAARLALLGSIDAAAKRQAWARTPFVGALCAVSFGLESYSPRAARLRRIESLAAWAASVLGSGVAEAAPAAVEEGAGSLPAANDDMAVSAGADVARRLTTLPAAFAGPRVPGA